MLAGYCTGHLKNERIGSDRLRGGADKRGFRHYLVKPSKRVRERYGNAVVKGQGFVRGGTAQDIVVVVCIN